MLCSITSARIRQEIQAAERWRLASAAAAGLLRAAAVGDHCPPPVTAGVSRQPEHGDEAENTARGSSCTDPYRVATCGLALGAIALFEAPAVFGKAVLEFVGAELPVTMSVVRKPCQAAARACTHKLRSLGNG